jgi:ABC-type sugar transport system substrate-binding protein
MPIIGFANSDENNLFSVAVRESLQQAVAAYPELELVTRDNALSTQKAMQHIDEFLSIPVDLAILFHIDERAGHDLVQPFILKGIPVISVDIPLFTSIFFGIDNQAAGHDAGMALADWIIENWEGALEHVIVITESRVLDVVRQRMESALDALFEGIEFARDNVLYLDSGSQADIIGARMTEVLDRWQDSHHIAVICINDNVAMGVLQAARKLDREADLAVVGFDGTSIAQGEFEREGSRMIASPSFRADRYGEGLIDLSLRLLAGEKVPRKNFVQPTTLTRWNYENYL